MSSWPTPWMPSTVAVTTGNTASTVTMAILETSNTPSHRMTTGRNTTFGMGKPIEMIGSKNQRASFVRAIAVPSTTPIMQAREKPTKVR